MKDFNELLKDNSQRKYAYNFDTTIMHYYFIEAFKPFFKQSKCLEIGSNKGQFTERLQHYFTDITCVEPSTTAITEAKDNIKCYFSTRFINDIFENIDFDCKYDTILATHILEHIESPVNFLTKAKEILNGHLIICVPNAHAASRQVAVKMGLIQENSSVTDGELKHGHKRTYSFDTLERDVKEVGLKIVHKGGIMFKALANFQYDKMIEQNIVTPEYFDGCYELGQQYPELCSSIYLICEK